MGFRQFSRSRKCKREELRCDVLIWHVWRPLARVRAVGQYEAASRGSQCERVPISDWAAPSRITFFIVSGVSHFVSLRRWHLGNSWEWMTPINPWHGTLQRAHLPVVRGPLSADKVSSEKPLLSKSNHVRVERRFSLSEDGWHFVTF